jgi:predicted short-subunit dehydrogenase-like oxidoreductase (DUF2520 family)
MSPLPRTYIFGAGKVGRALHGALRRGGEATTLRPARRGWPKRRLGQVGLVVLAVRDPEIPRQAEALRDARCLPDGAAVVHCAGSRGPDVLAPLRDAGVAVAQMHPLLAFASTRHPPSLRGAALQLRGDPEAVRRARALGHRLAMRPVELEGMNLELYHAAAALLANGAVGLAAGAEHLLREGGCPSDEIPRLLAPLLASVAGNLQALGLPEALTGPVRRGDATAVATHRARLRRTAPQLVSLYDAAVRSQLPLARALGEAESEAFDACENVLHDEETPA